MGVFLPAVNHMNDDFDINKVAAEFAKQHAEQFAVSAIRGVKDVAGQIRGRLDRTFRTYVDRILERYGRGKSFFVRTEATPIYDFFVPLSLSNPFRELHEPGAAQLCALSPFAIITGTGGSGKSMMMRHFLVNCIASGNKIPAFIELRQLNQTSDSVRELLLRTLNGFGLDLDERVLEPALSSGQFLLLLDGFDELERKARARVAREVQKLAEKYRKNWIVVSSRPDQSLQGWDTFTEYAVDPLSLGQAVSLVERLPFDEQVKLHFIRNVRERLFEEHRSFLSNPLLLSIMLLTYSDVAHIPHKLSTFYSQAYEALFHRHDALKGGFQRERRCSLDIQEYARAFAAFSLLSYDNREFAFTPGRALELVTGARGASMLSFDSAAFLDDAVQANCLLVEEGLNIVFAHRSFQEYFVARYIHASPPEVTAKLVARYAPVVTSDAVMALLWEMNPYIVEKYYLLPALERIRQNVGGERTLGQSHLLKYLRMCFSTFHIREQQVADEKQLRVSGTARDDGALTASMFAFNRYRDPIAALAHERARIEDDDLLEAFRADHGEAKVVPSEKLKARGRVLALLSKRGMYWGLTVLRALYAIEKEIQRKHESNRESLESVLASANVPRRRISRASTT